MSERRCRCALGALAFSLCAILAIGCGAARPALPEGIDLERLIASGNLAFFVEPRPAGPVRTAAFDHRGERLLTAHEEGGVYLWDARDGRPIAELARHDSGAAAAALSPDGSAIATAGARDEQVKIWDARTGAPITTCETAATAIAWSPDGALVAAGGSTGTVAICDARTGDRVGELVHAAEPTGATSSEAVGEQVSLTGEHAVGSGAAPVGVTAIAWSPDGQVLATAGSAGVVTFWNAVTREEVHSDLGHTGPVNDLAFGPDAERAVSAGEDGAVQILAPEGSDALATFYNESIAVRCAALSPDGERLAWGAADGVVKVWDARGGQQLLALEGHRGPVSSVAWSPDGKRLLTAGEDGAVRVLSADGGDELLSLSSAAPERMPLRAAWSPDGARLASTAGGAGLALWDPPSSDPHTRLRGPHHRPVDVAWSPDGARLASAGHDERVRLWNAEARAFVGQIRELDGRVLGLAWSPDSERLAAVGWGGIHVFDAAEGALSFASLDHAGAVNAVGFSRDGARLATGGADGEVKVWDAADGRELRAFATGAVPVTALCWSPTDARIAVGSDDGAVWLWSADTGEVEATLSREGLGAVLGLDWSPDGERIAITDERGAVLVWRYGGKDEVREIDRAGSASWSVDWHPNGRFLLVGSTDGARIHRLSDGRRLTLESFERGGDDAWLAFTDQGLFSGDEAAFGELSFRVRDDLRAEALLPVEAMVEAFYREDLLAEFLAGEPIAPPGED